VDVSAAQAVKLSGEERTRWDEVRGKLLDAIGNLADDVVVNVIAADDEIRTAFREARPLDPAARRQVRTLLEAQRPRGGCDLWAAMRAAFDQPGVDTVLVVSYAERDAGDLRQADRFFEAVQRRAETTRAVIHTVWLATKETASSEVKAADLMRRMAEDTRGRARMRTFD
jgi:hypothetical protein